MPASSSRGRGRLGRRRAVGQMMPGAAGPGDRADAGRQRVQPPEQRPEPAEAAGAADRLPALPAGHRAGPLGHQHGPAVEGRDRLVGRAPLGRELAGGHVPEDRGVARHRLGRPAGGEPPRHPVRAVGPADPPHADVEVGHRGHVDPVPRLQVQPQPLGGLARHRRPEADQVAVRIDVRALAQLVRRVADAPGQPADAGAGPLVVERVGVRDVQVGGADVLMVVAVVVAVALVLVPGVEGQVQAHPVPVGEAVAVALGVGLHVETERCVVRERAPQVANREDRAEAPQPGPAVAGSSI